VFAVQAVGAAVGVPTISTSEIVIFKEVLEVGSPMRVFAAAKIAVMSVSLKQAGVV